MDTIKPLTEGQSKIKRAKFSEGMGLDPVILQKLHPPPQ
jgi:hypothetical protein